MDADERSRALADLADPDLPDAIRAQRATDLAAERAEEAVPLLLSILERDEGDDQARESDDVTGLPTGQPLLLVKVVEALAEFGRLSAESADMLRARVWPRLSPSSRTLSAFARLGAWSRELDEVCGTCLETSPVWALDREVLRQGGPSLVRALLRSIQEEHWSDDAAYEFPSWPRCYPDARFGLLDQAQHRPEILDVLRDQAGDVDPAIRSRAGRILGEFGAPGHRGALRIRLGEVPLLLSPFAAPTKTADTEIIFRRSDGSVRVEPAFRWCDDVVLGAADGARWCALGLPPHDDTLFFVVPGPDRFAELGDQLSRGWLVRSLSAGERAHASVVVPEFRLEAPAAASSSARLFLETLPIGLHPKFRVGEWPQFRVNAPFYLALLTSTGVVRLLGRTDA